MTLYVSYKNSVEVAVLRSPSLIVLMVSELERVLPELRSRVKVEVAVVGSLSLIVCTVSVDVKRH